MIRIKNSVWIDSDWKLGSDPFGLNGVDNWTFFIKRDETSNRINPKQVFNPNQIVVFNFRLIWNEFLKPISGR